MWKSSFPSKRCRNGLFPSVSMILKVIDGENFTFFVHSIVYKNVGSHCIIKTIPDSERG